MRHRAPRAVNRRGRVVAALALLAAVAPAVAAGIDCEALRTQIDATIRARGVAAFTLTIVDAAAQAPGRVVGTCERGTRKIVYAPGAGAPGARSSVTAPVTAPVAVPATSPASAASAPRRSPPRPVITECRDGSTPADGVCRR